MDGVHSAHELVMYLGNTLDDYLSDEFFSLFPVDLPAMGIRDQKLGPTWFL
jgi:hypothetical protein